MAKSKPNRLKRNQRKLDMLNIDPYDKSQTNQFMDEDNTAQMIRENTYGDNVKRPLMKARILDLATLLIAGSDDGYDAIELTDRIFEITGLAPNRITRILREFADSDTHNTSFTNITSSLGALSYYWIGILAELKPKGIKVDKYIYQGMRKNKELQGYYNPELRNSLHNILGLTNPQKRSFAPSVQWFCDNMGINYQSRRKVVENYANGRRYPADRETRMDLAVLSTLWMLDNIGYYEQYQFGRPKKEDIKITDQLLLIYLSLRPDIAVDLKETFKKIQPDYKYDLDIGFELAGLNFAVNEDCIILAVIHIGRELGLNESEIVNASWRFFGNSLTSVYSKYSNADLGRRHIREYVGLIMSENITKMLLEQTGSISFTDNPFDRKYAVSEFQKKDNDKYFKYLLERKFYRKSRLAEIVFTSMQETFERFIKRLDEKFNELRIGD